MSERKLVIGVVMSVAFLFGVVADVALVMCFELGWKFSLGIERVVYVRCFRVVEIVIRFISVIIGSWVYLK
jgi:hypothetical protein